MTLLDDLRAGALRPSGKLTELGGMHLPFDHMLGVREYEQRVLGEICAEPVTVAVVGEPGAGKSSLIAYVIQELPDGHLAVPIRGRGLGAPGDLDHFLSALLRSGLRAVDALGGESAPVQEAAADSIRTSTTPPAIKGGKLGGGPVPAELRIELGSLAEEVEREVKDFDRLEGAQRLIGVLATFECTPVFVLHDVEAHLGADATDDALEQFFTTIVGALVDDIDAPALIALQDRYQANAAYGRIRPRLREVIVPRLAEPERDLEALLSHRMQFWGIAARASDAFTDRALLALATSYHEPGGLRRVLSIAEAAVTHALDDADSADDPDAPVMVDVADVHAALGGITR